MPKLRMMKPRIGLLAPRVKLMGAAPEGADRAERERVRHRERDRAQEWRGWYKTERWRQLRIKTLRRDEWTCRQTGVLCTGKHPAANSPVVDHIKPHRGDERLFWDENNLQVVSKEYHDREKQRQERRGAGLL